ncbi:MAG TPA: hypothetical protein VIJ00_13610 [Nakamurella sp.]
MSGRSSGGHWPQYPPSRSGAVEGDLKAASDIDRFWQSPPLPPRPAVLPVDTDLRLRLLPSPWVALGGETLVRWLRPAYEQFAALAP